ncbi:MAG: hypothetical protein ACOC2J_02060, partial [bacterium]
NYIGGIATLFAVFLLIFLGYRGIAGGTETYGTGLSDIIVGYVMWMVALVIYQDISDALINEAREGILEHLYMSPYGYTKIIFCRLFISFVTNMLMIKIVLFIIIMVTGRTLNLDFISILPLLIIFLLPIIGLSFILGGIQLLFKKVSAFMQLIQFFLIALVALPVDGSFYWARFLPGTLASSLMRDVMVSQQNILEITPLILFQALAIGSAYLAIGWYIFKLCERKAMTDGRLAHY